MRTSRSGFSLIEVLVAMVLLAGVGGAMIYGFSSSGSVVQSDYGIAYNVARAQLEELFEQVRQDTWPNAALPLSKQTAPARPAIPPKALNGKTFTTTYAVNSDTNASLDANGDGQEDYRLVKMTVNW